MINAPLLVNSMKYHIFFVYDENDRDWVLALIRKLEMNNVYCCSSEGSNNPVERMSAGAVLSGLRTSLRTVVVVSPDFLNRTWVLVENIITTEIENDLNLLLIRLQKCDLPNSLSDFKCIDAAIEQDWFALLVTVICSSGLSIILPKKKKKLFFVFIYKYFFCTRRLFFLILPS